MKAATAKDIKTELKHKSASELMDLCLRLSRFKKENKELLTYLLFEAENETSYINSVTYWIEEEFKTIKRKTHYHTKKGVRKILRHVKKYIRYSGNKETEVILLLAFCRIYASQIPAAKTRLVYQNIYNRQIELIRKRILLLHEDLQYDYGLELKELQLS